MADESFVDKVLGKAKSQARGTAAQAAILAPTLFQQVLPGLFGGQEAARFEESFFDRFKRIKFGGIFGPSKAEREAFEREQTAELAAINRRTQGIAGQLRVSGRGDVLQFPAARRAVEAAALGEPQGLADVEALLASQTQAQVTAQTKRQVTADETAQEQLAALVLEREGGRFGSGLDSAQFRTLEAKVAGQMAGASKLFNIADIVENLTDLEIAAIGSGTGGELQGQIEADLFNLMAEMQTLLEKTPSVLRKSDQELILGALGNPAELSELLFSREAKTIGKIRRFGELLQEDAQRSLNSVDNRTLALIAGVNKITPSNFTRPAGPTVAAGETRPEQRARAQRAAASIPSEAQIRGTQLSGPRGPIIQQFEEALQAAPKQLGSEFDEIVKRFQEAFE